MFKSGKLHLRGFMLQRRYVIVLGLL